MKKEKAMNLKIQLVNVEKNAVQRVANCFIEMLRVYKLVSNAVNTAELVFEEKVIFLFENHFDKRKVNILSELYLAVKTGENQILLDAIKAEVKNMALRKHSLAIMSQLKINSQ